MVEIDCNTIIQLFRHFRLITFRLTRLIQNEKPRQGETFVGAKGLEPLTFSV